MPEHNRRVGVLKMRCALMLVMLLAMAVAANVQVTKQLPSTIQVGQIAEFNITLENKDLTNVSLTVREDITGSNPVDPPKAEEFASFDYKMVYYEWKVVLEPGESRVISYAIRPTETYWGVYSSPESVAYTADNQVFKSEKSLIGVTCNNNGICEEKETEFNCPKDCERKDWFNTSASAQGNSVETGSPKADILSQILMIAGIGGAILLLLSVAAFFLLRAKGKMAESHAHRKKGG
jgi:hypothetical protein